MRPISIWQGIKQVLTFQPPKGAAFELNDLAQKPGDLIDENKDERENQQAETPSKDEFESNNGPGENDGIGENDGMAGDGNKGRKSRTRCKVMRRPVRTGKKTDRKKEQNIGQAY